MIHSTFDNTGQADFSVSLYPRVGTLAYVAPEILQGKGEYTNYTKKAKHAVS